MTVNSPPAYVSQTTAYNFVAASGNVKLVASAQASAEPQFVMGDDGQMTLVVSEATMQSLLASLDESTTGSDVFVGGNALAKLVEQEATHNPGEPMYQSLASGLASGVSKIKEDDSTLFMMVMDEVAKSQESGGSYFDVLARMRRKMVGDSLERVQLGNQISAHSMIISFDASMASVQALVDKGEELEDVKTQRVTAEAVSGVLQAGTAATGGVMANEAATTTKQVAASKQHLKETAPEFAPGGSLANDPDAVAGNQKAVNALPGMEADAAKLSSYAQLSTPASQAEAALTSSADTAAQVDGQIAENEAQIVLTTNQAESEVAKDQGGTGTQMAQSGLSSASSILSNTDRAINDLSSSSARAGGNV